MINVLVVDDHELVRSGFEQLLSCYEAIRVVGVASSGEEAVEKVKDLHPDVVLMDIHMPGMGGIEACRKIVKKHTSVKVIALSAMSDGPIPQQLFTAGAVGFITKSCAVTELIGAISDVHDGKTFVSIEVSRAIALSSLRNPENLSPFEQLSQRELQIVLMTLQGKEPAEIAELLVISSKTVNTYRHRAYCKLGVKNGVELMRLSIKHKLKMDSL